MNTYLSKAMLWWGENSRYRYLHPIPHDTQTHGQTPQHAHVNDDDKGTRNTQAWYWCIHASVISVLQCLRKEVRLLLVLHGSVHIADIGHGTIPEVGLAVTVVGKTEGTGAKGRMGMSRSSRQERTWSQPQAPVPCMGRPEDAPVPLTFRCW